jgi:hypothetical protein
MLFLLRFLKQSETARLEKLFELPMHTANISTVDTAPAAITALLSMHVDA